MSSLVYKYDDNDSLYKLITNKNDVMETTNYIGLSTTIGIDVYKNLTGFEETIEIDLTAIEPVIEIPEEKKTEYNMINIDFDTLLTNEKDESVKTLHQYFSSQNPTNKNEMTGIFKGKNVIIMLLESVNEIAILNEEDFPTLYKMYHEGISFTNNFSPRNNCSTGNNEMTVNTSLFTINNSCTANSYTRNDYPEAYMSMFRKIGYSTSAYHDYTQHYYYRATYGSR